MQYKIVVYEQNNETKINNLDVFEDFDIALNFNILDIRNLGAFNSNYSKTIVIPATKNNNKIFDLVYNINKKVFNFDKNKTLKCAILFDDVKIISGNLLLNQINYIKNDAYEYECVIYGDFYSIYDKLGTQSVFHLDWSVDKLPEFTISSTTYSTSKNYGLDNKIEQSFYKNKTRNWFNKNGKNVTTLLNEVYRKTDTNKPNLIGSDDTLKLLINNYNNNFIDLNYTTSNLFTASNFYNNSLHPSPLFVGINNLDYLNDSNLKSTIIDDRKGAIKNRYISLSNFNFPVFDWRLLYIKILKDNGYILTSDSYNFLFNKTKNIYNDSSTIKNQNIFQDTLLLKTDYSKIENLIEYIEPIINYTQATQSNQLNINNLRNLHINNLGNESFSYSIAQRYEYKEIYPIMPFNAYLSDNNTLNDILSASSSVFVTGSGYLVQYSNVATYSLQSNKFIWNKGAKNHLNGNPFSFDSSSSIDYQNNYANKAVMSDVNDKDFDQYTFYVTHHSLFGVSDINSNPNNFILNLPSYEYKFYGLTSGYRGGCESVYYNDKIDAKSQILRNFRNDNIIYFNYQNRNGLNFQKGTTPKLTAGTSTNFNEQNKNNTLVDDVNNNFNYIKKGANNLVFNTDNPESNFGKYIVEDANYYQFECGLFSRLEFRNEFMSFGTTASTYEFNDTNFLPRGGYITDEVFPKIFRTYYDLYVPGSTTKNIKGTYSYNIGVYVEKDMSNYEAITINKINDNEIRNIKQIGTLSYSFNLNDFYTYEQNYVNYEHEGYNYYLDDSTNIYSSLHIVPNYNKIYVGTTSINYNYRTGGTMSVDSPEFFDGFKRYITDPKFSSCVSEKIWLDKGDKVFVQYLTKNFEDGASYSVNPQGLTYGMFFDDGTTKTNIANINNNLIDRTAPLQNGANKANYNEFGDNFYPIIDYYQGFVNSLNYDYSSNLILGTNSNILNKLTNLNGNKGFGKIDGNFFTGYVVHNENCLSIPSNQQVKFEHTIYLKSNSTASGTSSFFSFENGFETRNFTTFSNTNFDVIPEKIEQKGLYFLDIQGTTLDGLSFNNEAKIIDYFNIGGNYNTATFSINKFYDLEKGMNRYCFLLYTGLTYSNYTASTQSITIGTNSSFKIYSIVDTDFIRNSDKIFIDENVKQSDIIKDFNRLYNIVMLPDTSNSNILKISTYEDIEKTNENWSDKLDLDSDYKVMTNNDLLKGYSIEYLKGEDKYSGVLDTENTLNNLSYDRLSTKFEIGENITKNYNVNVVNYTDKSFDKNKIIVDEFSNISNVYWLKNIGNVNNDDISEYALLNQTYLNTKLYANTAGLIKESKNLTGLNYNGVYYINNYTSLFNNSINYNIYSPTIHENNKYYYTKSDGVTPIKPNRYVLTPDLIHSYNYQSYKDGFLLVCYLRLDTLIINKLQLQNYIILNLDGNYTKWIINKIVDYNPTKNLTKVELIKINI